MCKRLILYIMCLMVCSSLVSAYDFDVSYDVVTDDIYQDEGAIFRAHITNNENVERRYRVSLSDYTLWTLQTEPLSHRLSGIVVGPGETKESQLMFYPTAQAVPGRYSITIYLKKADSNQEIRKSVEINLKSRTMKIPDYQPNLKVESTLPDNGKIDPRGTKTVMISLKNRNALYIEDCDLTLKSKLIDEQVDNIDLEPLERKELTFDIAFDPMEAPKKDVLVVTASVGNKTFVTINNYEIIGYETDFTVESQTVKKLFKRTDTYTLTNNANIPHTEVFKVRTSFFKGLFTATDPESSIVKEEGNRYASWHVSLESGESYHVTIIRNYRPLIFVLIILAVVIYSYILWRPALVIAKTVSEVGLRDGGVSKFKVQLIVKNRTNVPINEVHIIDKVPTIASVDGDFPVGTLQPTKVLKKEKSGTILKWFVETLEAQEERVITYNVKSRLSILGGFNLPLAVGKYKNDKGNTKSTTSNTVTLGKQ